MNEKPSSKDRQITPARGPSAAGPSTAMVKQTRSSAPGRPPQQNAADSGINAAFILFVFRRWWKVVLPVGLLLAGLTGATVMYFYVPEYQASALIEIESTEPYIAFAQTAGTRGADRYIQTQIELLRSLVVLETVISRPEIASIGELKEQSDPPKYMQQHLSISQRGKSDLYNVHYTSPSPADARAVANAVVAEYLSLQSSEDFERSRRVIDLLEEERNRRSLDVERLRSRLMELAKDITGTDPFGNEGITDPSRAINPVASLAQQLVEIDVNRALLEAEIQSFSEASILMPDHAESTGLLDLEIANRPDVQEQEAAISEIRSQMEHIRSVARKWSINPTHIRHKKELETREAALARMKSMLREKLLAKRKGDRKQQHQQSIVSLKRELTTLDAKKKLLTEHYDKQMEGLKDGGAKSVQFEFAQATLAREEKIFEMIAVRKLALQTELRAPARVRLRQEAKAPRTPLKPAPYMVLLGSCLAAFAAPLGLAVVRERAMRRINDTGQLAQESKLRVLGEVAQLPVRPMVSGSKSLPRRSLQEMMVFTESIDSLRTSLDLSEYLGSHNVLAITSAEAAEGKTNVAISLAESIAGATGRPTLILDGDLRKRGVPIHFDDEYSPGLSEVLTNECSLSEAIHQIDDTNTYYLPAGHAKVNPHHVVREHRIGQLLDDLRPDYSAIVIDTPPILSASESLVFAKAADAVVFCSLRDVSRSKQVRIAVERLEQTGANVLGAVLSGTSQKHYTYMYGAY